jgi:superfamily II DNA or RNA helicase
MKKESWNLTDALKTMQARIDPYIWEQGQELFQRGAVEDFQVAANGTIQVRVLDPRDLRKFFVSVERDRAGRVVARCPCPYRLNGYCRHQVVSLEYLRSIAEEAARPVEEVPSPGASPGAAPETPPDPGQPPAASRQPLPGSVLYRLRGPSLRITTRPDGSLLRVVLHSLGSRGAPHRIGLQLFTGSGWTELRTPEVGRWISRGDAEPHPRDAAIASHLVREGAIRSAVDSEAFSALLLLLSESDALVTRTGEPLPVSRWPHLLAARLVRSREGLGVEFSCRSPEGESRPLAEVELIPSVAPWIQVDTGAFHPLVAGATGPVLAELAEEDLSEISGEELDRLLSRGVAELERLCPGAFETEPGLIAEVEGVDGARLRLAGTPERLAGKLEFSYGGEWTPAPLTPEPWTIQRDGEVVRYPPAGQSLARAERELESIGLRREEEEWVIDGAGALAAVLRPRPRGFVQVLLPSQVEALDLVHRAPRLRLEVKGEGDAPGAEGAEIPASGGRRGSGIAWLEVSWRLLDGERELPLDLPALGKALAEDPGGTVVLEDGTVLGLDHASVRSLLELAGPPGEGGAREERLRVPIARIGELMEEVPAREVAFRGRARALIDGLRPGARLEEEALEPRVEATLRPYQKEAVRWLGHLAGLGLAGILADEMGLGKTIMTLAHFFGRADRPGGEAPRGKEAPVLVICPSSLVFNWLDECRRFFPAVEAAGLHGLSPEAREEQIAKGADLLITSYALLRRDRAALEARELRAVVLDEGQHVKNPESQTAQAAFSLTAAERWILTGTPIENRPEELWSLFHFLMPGFLGSRGEFAREIAEPVSRRDEEASGKLRARLRPFLLRRTKAQVLAELPPRIEQIERVPMTPLQERLYRSYLLEARQSLEEADPQKARFQILTALTRLRQISCHPRLVLDKEAAAEIGEEGVEITGGKFELCLELLQECREEGHRVLLYSQFTSMLDLIEERLVAEGISYARLDGSTRDREGVVREFQKDPTIPVFLISLKAGGYGLNLTQADTVIIYDPWWNPAVEEQAAARAHRMGQTLPVHVHKLITGGTVEEKILDLQAKKSDLAARLVGAEEGAGGALDLDELRAVLFEG